MNEELGYVKTMVEQPMVANFDYVFIVTSLNDDYNYNRVARYVSHTLQSNAIPVVILTKMDTSEIREADSKGRHTTTYHHLVELDNGVTLIDTPGMREIGMQSAAEGIEDVFSDIKELECQCRFRDCRHKTEPGCAVKRAIEEGKLSEERYELYLSLFYENMRNNQMKKQTARNKKRAY